MSISHPLKRGVIAVSAAFSLLAAATPAQASFSSFSPPGAVIGSFDPAFGLDIPNLGFKGSFQLTVLGCDPGAGGGYAFNGSNNGACAITMDSVTLNFYNSTANPQGDPAGDGGYLKTYTLGSANSDYPSAFQSYYVQGVYYNADDVLVGFDTDDSNPFNVSVFDTTSVRPQIAYNGNMLLYFASGHEPYEPEGEDPAFLVDCKSQIPDTNASSCNRADFVNSNGARVTINGVTEGGVVAEPETVPLALIGLGAIAAIRRRNRRASRKARPIAR